MSATDSPDDIRPARTALLAVGLPVLAVSGLLATTGALLALHLAGFDSIERHRPVRGTGRCRRPACTRRPLGPGGFRPPVPRVG
ncbi:hypothetical protein GMA12_11945 [Kocuria sediminis]|uniref:Uncharacterized protein n=1 Tax=Kocuria sediminis TaxID=1038857 RepID=A0A6N8GM44_9MICC|nr:hypothetical protein [Kocuria sediminis]MUN63839.1 hypothetical protein [Kocuria sediminis]